VSFRWAQLPAHHREEYARDTGSIHKTDEQEDFEKYAAGSANRRHKFLWVFRRNMQLGPDRAHILGHPLVVKSMVALRCLILFVRHPFRLRYKGIHARPLDASAS
jgi:hypothetical protein